MKDIDRIYNLIVKELTSANSIEEQEVLQEDLSNNPELKKKFNILKEFWTRFFPQKQKHNILSKTEKKLDFTYGPGSKIKKNYLLKVAVIILFVLSVSFSAYQVIKPKQEIVLNEYISRPGEIKEVVLSDGTKVWLNSASMIIASEPFIGDTREVKLFGEAYFEVAYKPEQPFIVKTPFLQTKALGTKFNISALAPNTRQEISLYEGKVQLILKNNNNKNLILTPDERAYFTSETGKISVVKTDLGEPAKWRDGILRFYNEDLFSITKKLERKFHTRIMITDSIVGDLKFTAEFEVESLDDILKLLKEAHSFAYVKTENGIIIQKQT
ncbi:FecR domain-containing protein [Draconibacterium sp.]|nr:FecR domain-containing protein [Draconibacterium sp.]